MDLDRIVAFLRALAAKDVDYVIVGGVALNLHGIVRATEDIDVFIRTEPGNVERLRDALRSVWDDPSIDEITYEDLAGDYPVVRYGPPGETFVIDVMSRLGEAFDFADLQVETIEIEGVVVRVATPTTLYEMKKSTVRPIDKADAEALRDAFDIPDDRP